MNDLFVTQAGPDVRVCRQDDDGKIETICMMGEFTNADELLGEDAPTETDIQNWLYMAHLIASVPKMMRAIELQSEVDQKGLVFSDADLLKHRREAMEAANNVILEALEPCNE